jgi:hypothetical protein
MPPFDVAWDPGRTLLTTRVRGPLSVEDVIRYRDVLAGAIGRIPPDTTFLWLSDASGYEALANRAAHESLRTILPETLAAHGFRTSLLDLYEGPEVTIERRRGVACLAIAHVHHDIGKMAFFDERFGRANERYFAAEDSALAWLGARRPLP